MKKKFGHLNVKNIDYHRNGISGIGFHIALFKTNYEDCPDLMLGIIFPEDGAVAVVSVPKLANNDIEFASNSWRGDWFETDLREAVKVYEKTGWKEKLK